MGCLVSSWSEAKDLRVGWILAARSYKLMSVTNREESGGWGLAMQKIFENLMPWGTKQRRIFQLGFSAIQIIRYQGWRVFWSKASPKIKLFLLRNSADSYHRWILKNEPSLNALELQKQTSLSFNYRPKISIVMPVWNSEMVWLGSAIESVIRQTYDNWELCIADGASTNPSVREVLDQYFQDTRIKIKYLSQNLGISGNSNAALSLAVGEFVAFLDHDDELAPFALFELVKRLNEKPDLDFIYSDEDKITDGKRRVDPFFKPDWSPDFLLSTMYTCHLSTYRKKIIDEIVSFRLGYDGSQDYDLVLRFVENTTRIDHIPKILYHWRMVLGSAANDVNAKPYAYLAGKKALTDYMQRNGILGEVLDGAWPGLYRVRRQITGNPLVSIIIPSKDKPDILKTCIESVLNKTDYPNYEIIIVDNQSSDNTTFEYYKTLETHSRVNILHYDQPFNFSAINNFAVSKAKGEHILFLNNDTEVISREWLTSMLEHSQRKEVGAVGAQLLFRNKSIQHCGIILGLQGIAGHPYSRQYGNHYQGARPSLICNYSAVTAACMMMRKSVFTEVGGFDSELAIDYNDIDLCLKIRKLGYLVVYTPYAKLFHLECLTRGHKDNPEKMQVFQKEFELMRFRWGSIIDHGDPYYNPNLSLDRANFSLKN